MGSSVRQTPDTYLLDLIKNLARRVEELEADSLTQADAVVESLQVGEPNNTPGGFGDASLAGDLIAEGLFNLGSPTTPAALDGHAAIEGNLSVEGTISGTGVVTGGDSHDHDGGDGAVIPEAGLAAAVIAQLVTNGDTHDHVGGDGNPIAGIVTGGDSHDHIGGDGAAIDTDALAAGAVTNPKIGAQAVDTAELANLAVGTAKIAADAVDDTKAGDRVPQFYRRKGGSSSNWSTQGTSTYTPGAVRIQGGVKRITISDGTTGNTGSLNFGVSFSGAPIVVIGVKSANRAHIRIDSISSSGFGYGAFRTPSSGDWDIDIHWLAVGPE